MKRVRRRIEFLCKLAAPRLCLDHRSHIPCGAGRFILAVTGPILSPAASPTPLAIGQLTGVGDSPRGVGVQSPLRYISEAL
jgi:hypothetical protein